MKTKKTIDSVREKLIIETLNSIGWKEMFRETVGRIDWFISEFRKVIAESDINKKDLTKFVTYEFGIYGQGEVYNIYMNAIKKPDNTVDYDHDFSKDYIKFKKQFKKYLYSENNKVGSQYSPEDERTYIHFIFEYIFAKHIGAKNDMVKSFSEILQ